MKNHPIRRREFIKVATAAAGTFALHSYGVPSVAYAHVNRRVAGVRQDINTWTPAQLAALNAAVGVMMRRDRTDPTNWLFQANIHGSVLTNNPAWNQCQHGSWWFLPWHRAYLYWFERILSAASQQAGHGPLSLPYWNYSPAANQAVPAPYRTPDTYPHLFQIKRHGGINLGHPLPCPHVDWTRACNFTTFLPASRPPRSRRSFGGGSIPAPTQFAKAYGRLEMQPHNLVHDSVGGLMGDILTAAQDPVFWAHHGNIDRMWNGWLAEGGGRQNPVENTAWMQQSFSFFDEQGQPVTTAVHEVLDTAALGYTYDSLPSCPQTTPCAKTLRILTVVDAEEAPVTAPLAAARQEVVLGGTPVRVPLRPAAGSRQRLLAVAGDEDQEVLLRVEGVRADENPGLTYDFYLNLPRGAARDPRGLTPAHPNYLATLEFFQVITHLAHGPEDTLTLETEVTEAVRAMLRQGGLNVASHTITIVPTGVAPPPGERLQAAAPAFIGSIVLHAAPAVTEP